MLPGHRQRAYDGSGTYVDGEALQKFRRHLVLLALVEHDALHRFTADENILRHAQIFHQVQFLMDDGDAQRLRVARVVNIYALAVEQDFARVHLIYAREHLHQRRFPSAVFAHQRVHLPAFEFKAAVVQCVYSWKVLLYPPHLQQDFSHTSRTSLSETCNEALTTDSLYHYFLWIATFFYFIFYFDD